MRASRSKPSNRRDPDVVALRQLLQRGTIGPTLACLGLLPLGEGRGAAHMLSARFGTVSTLGRPGADQVSLYVGQATQQGRASESDGVLS